MVEKTCFTFLMHQTGKMEVLKETLNKCVNLYIFVMSKITKEYCTFFGILCFVSPIVFLAGEYFSRESKFEIVLLEWGAECMELSPSSPQVHCGRYPHFTCHSRATSISRLAKCASFNGKLMGKRVSGSMQTYSRFGNSPCSSSPCYF